MTGHRVLVADQIPAAAAERLRAACEVDVRPGLSEDELIDAIGGYSAIVVGSGTVVSEPVIAAGSHLEVIAKAGPGLDNIDVESAVRAGIELVNSPDTSTVAQAELTLGLMLALARDIARADAAIKAGSLSERSTGPGLAGKTLGIIGFGPIGREVATRASAFGMDVITNQRRRTPELAREVRVETVDLFELLSRSDYVSIHVPSDDENQGMLGRAELAAMKPTAFLINTSRDWVVMEDALLEALDAGTIAGAGLDVFDTDALGSNPLASHPRVVAIPRSGVLTRHAAETAALDVVDAVLRRFTGPVTTGVLPLAIVPVDQVVAHETVDERRSALLVEQIRAVGLLRNPPVVTRVDDRYIVLDGATRSAAMRALDIPHLAVQEVNVDEHLGLETWHHVVRDVTATALLQTLGAVDEIRLEEEQPGAAVVRNIEYGAIASVTTVDGRAFLVHAEPGVNRFDALGAFAASYMSAASVSRTLERNLRTLASWHPGMVALIEYPEFTVQQVLDAAASGRLLPAGVTRFAIPGRVLRLDLPLEILVSDQTLEAKNAWLQDQLAEKERQGRIRYYGEPVYVLDE